MLLQSLLETPADDRHARRWATLISFTLQALGIGLLVLSPFLYTQALPGLRDRIVVLPVPSGGPPHGGEQRPISHRERAGEFAPATQQPRFIPRGIHQGPEPARQDAEYAAPEGPFVPGATGTGNGGPVLDSILRGTATVAIAPPARHPPVQVSQGVTAGWKIHDAQPVYPALAVTAHLQGDVILNALIGADGNIENLQAVSGHPMLIPAALEAVRQWRYRPYYLNGVPVEVATQITVRFILGKN